MKIFLACCVGLAGLIGVGVMEDAPGGFLAPPPAPSSVFANDPPPDKPHDWFIADRNFTSCIKTEAPAKKIEFLRMGGGDASTNESRDANGNLLSVEVSAPSADGLNSTYWTYYTGIDACQAALTSRNHIPDEYR